MGSRAEFLSGSFRRRLLFGRVSSSCFLSDDVDVTQRVESSKRHSSEAKTIESIRRTALKSLSG